jgi:hypothetical protein
MEEVTRYMAAVPVRCTIYPINASRRTWEQKYAVSRVAMSVPSPRGLLNIESGKYI